MTGPLGAMPSPPFPDPQSALLKLIVENAVNALNSGQATPEMAILFHGANVGHVPGAAGGSDRADRAAHGVRDAVGGGRGRVDAARPGAPVLLPGGVVDRPGGPGAGPADRRPARPGRGRLTSGGRRHAVSPARQDGPPRVLDS